MRPSRALRTLANAHGIQTSYVDVDGRLTHAETEVLLSVLRSLGAAVSTEDDAVDGLRELRTRRTERIVEPVYVLWDDATPGVRLTLPAELESRHFAAHIELESGDHHTWAPSARIVLGRRRHDGRPHLRVWLPLPTLPHGYHRLHVELGSRHASCTIVRAPDTAYRAPGRDDRVGLFFPLYGLHSHASRGIGNISDLKHMGELVRSRGGDFVATLPFFATFPDEPSPYSPISRRFWNELFIDPARTPEWQGGTTSESTISELIDYPSVARKTWRTLEQLAARSDRVRPGALAAFQERTPLAAEYARFRAERGPASVDVHLYAQMVAEEQLREVSSEHALYLDMPLGVHRAGFDVFKEPELFGHELSVGVPPDAVFPGGQNWSFPPVLPEKSRESSHAYFRQSFQAAMRHADVLRVDHVMGLHRQFWIPDGADGVYVRYPSEELYGVLTLESHRSQCELVGENLGLVPASVDAALVRHGIRGIYVLQYSLTGDPELPCRRIPEASVASINTHDTPPFAAFCEGLDTNTPQERAQRFAAIDALGGAEPLSEKLHAWLHLLKSSPAELVSVTLEDLWLERERQNVPGTTTETPNWKRRLRYSIEEIEAQPVLLERAFRR